MPWPYNQQSGKQGSRPLSISHWKMEEGPVKLTAQEHQAPVTSVKTLVGMTSHWLQLQGFAGADSL